MKATKNWLTENPGKIWHLLFAKLVAGGAVIFAGLDDAVVSVSGTPDLELSTWHAFGESPELSSLLSHLHSIALISIISH